MASFQKYTTKKGIRWMFTLDGGIDKQTGKRKQIKRRGFQTLDSAKQFARQIENDLDVGKEVFHNQITFVEFSEQWIKIYEEERGVKPGTTRVRRHEIGNLNQYLGSLKMDDITWEIYQNMLYKLNERFSRRTLDGIHRTGRMIFKKAMQHDIIRKDPTEYAYLPKKAKTIEELEQEVALPKYMEKENLARFLQTAKQNGLELDFEIFLTLAYTGIRVGELCALKSTDVTKREEFFLSISKTYYNPNNNIKKFQLVTPKTLSSRRTIDIDYIVYQALTKLIEENEFIRNEAGEEYYDDTFIFVNRGKYLGYPIYPKIVQQRMTRLLRIADLDDHLTPHSLRHTHASLLAEAGVSLERIMERLGHSEDKTTRQIYLHTTEPVRRKDAEKFGNLMKNITPF
ncbi:tyrosine-type recombinase/integrase [Virgibacillus xinjiangensis]|uniref:Tyrosine-type recombinase/integrase n=1 Tax=Virgibacillus xinjiangensis TaxID=393090 RepID=A0ABV7CYZ0_9BACI